MVPSIVEAMQRQRENPDSYPFKIPCGGTQVLRDYSGDAAALIAESGVEKDLVSAESGPQMQYSTGNFQISNLYLLSMHFWVRSS